MVPLNCGNERRLLEDLVVYSSGGVFLGLGLRGQFGVGLRKGVSGSLGRVEHVLEVLALLRLLLLNRCEVSPVLQSLAVLGHLLAW